MNQRDRKLGMGRNITRRDFINGVAATAAGGALSPTSILASGETLPTYPPALTGLRGSHDGSWEVAHRLREDNPWRSVGADADTGESFDLVVVGGGLSGLAAAHFFRVSHGPNARILILDNHDDFGGHAKRNEFQSDKRFSIGYGGSQSLDTPSSFSPEVSGLLKELGVELERFETAFDSKLYRSLGLSRGEFYDRETFGVDRLVVRGSRSFEDYAPELPFSDDGRQALVRFFSEPKAYLEAIPASERMVALKGMSYQQYLADLVRLPAEVMPYFFLPLQRLFLLRTRCDFGL